MADRSSALQELDKNSQETVTMGRRGPSTKDPLPHPSCWEVGHGLGTCRLSPPRFHHISPSCQNLLRSKSECIISLLKTAPMSPREKSQLHYGALTPCARPHAKQLTHTGKPPTLRPTQEALPALSSSLCCTHEAMAALSRHAVCCLQDPLWFICIHPPKFSSEASPRLIYFLFWVPEAPCRLFARSLDWLLWGQGLGLLSLQPRNLAVLGQEVTLHKYSSSEWS